MNIIIISLFTLVSIGALSSIILYFVSKKFKVFENPQIDKLVRALPGVNCGGCGYPSCRGFAIACVHAESLENMVCTVGKISTMKVIGNLTEKKVSSVIPTVAVVKCGGRCDVRVKTNRYEGVRSCAIAHNLYGGQTGCSFGCLGLGDCEKSCKFDAIQMNKITQLPEIDEEKCTSCNACVKACPKMILELRKMRHKKRQIYVSCINKDQGESIRESCSVACTGCGKCLKECAYDAISIVNNLAYIDSDKCTLCRRCVGVCKTNSIVEVDFAI